MTQTVTLENGEQHFFPDDATPDEMNKALASMDLRQRENSMLHPYGSGIANIGRNITAGLVSGLQGMVSRLPDLHTMVPQSMQSALPYAQGQAPVNTFDAYKAFGTTDQPFYTLQGAMQTVGELLSGGAAAKMAPVFKSVEGMSAIKSLNPSDIINDTKDLTGKIHDAFSPGKDAKNILDQLGQGAQNDKQVTQSITHDIRDAYDQRNETAGLFFNHPL